MSAPTRSQFTLRFVLAVMVAAAISAFCISKYGLEASGPFILMVAMAFGLTLIGKWLVAGVKMTENDPTRPKKLETFNDNYQASVLVSRLQENGIKATAVGGFVSGFQAESPGYVDVVVVQSDFERAKELYDLWQSEKEIEQ